MKVFVIAGEASGDDTAGEERPAVADAVDLVADRFGVVTGSDEVGADRMRTEVRFGGEGRGAQCLGDDLAAVEAAPRVAGSGPDEGVGAVRGEFEHSR